MSKIDNPVPTIPTSPKIKNLERDYIRCVLVDDHQVVRQGVRAMLAIEEDMLIVGDYASAEEAIPQIETLRPDIVLLDFRMPGMNGIEACRLLRAKGITSDVIILTLYEEHFAEAMRAGAKGYLPKDMKREELTETIRQIYRLRKSSDHEDFSTSFGSIDLVVLAPSDTSQIMRFIEFAPSALQGSIEQVVKLLDDSIAITMNFENNIEYGAIVDKLKRMSGVKLIEKQFAAKPGFLWPFKGALRSNRSDKNQIMINLGAD